MILWIMIIFNSIKENPNSLINIPSVRDFLTTQRTKHQNSPFHIFPLLCPFYVITEERKKERTQQNAFDAFSLRRLHVPFVVFPQFLGFFPFQEIIKNVQQDHKARTQKIRESNVP